jgi:hypothetical protein
MDVRADESLRSKIFVTACVGMDSVRSMCWPIQLSVHNALFMNTYPWHWQNTLFPKYRCSLYIMAVSRLLAVSLWEEPCEAAGGRQDQQASARFCFAEARLDVCSSSELALKHQIYLSTQSEKVFECSICPEG